MESGSTESKPVESVPAKKAGAEPRLTVAGLSYKYFLWAGKPLTRWFKLEKTLDAAKMSIYPEAYASAIVFYTTISAVISAIALAFFLEFLSPLLTGLPAGIPYAFLTIPFIVLALGVVIPKIAAQNRASNLDIEVPFASAYISVMATSGVSPFRSLKRLKDVDLLPNVSKASKSIDVEVNAMGVDPVAAMEHSAANLPSKEYKDLLLGYAATLKSGGDVVHYLLRRTEVMFNDKVTKLKSMIDRIGLLTEAYIAITILAGLSFYAMYTTTFALAPFFGEVAGFGGDTFFLFGWVLLPSVSIMFLYLIDTSQPKYPITEMGPYKVYAASIPLFIFLIFAMFLPFTYVELKSIPGIDLLVNFVEWVTASMGLIRGYESSIGLALALIIGTIPAAVANSIYTRRSQGIEQDTSNFLRDLVENRKSGLSPERCIVDLSNRDYGKLSKHLKVISRQIQWGFPFRTIYETFRQKVKSWNALVNMYLLVDAIEVGGGSPETLESLAEFSEATSSLEKEKKQTLRPLLFIPYVGAAILLFSVIVFLAFMKGILSSMGGQSISMGDFASILIPPLFILSYMMGIVTGKISSGSISAGFKHAILLTIGSLIAVWLSPYFTIPFQSIIG
jgi:flagellar protein FlaJ